MSELDKLIEEVRWRQADGQVAEFSLKEVAGAPEVQVRAVGDDKWLRRLVRRLKDSIAITREKPLDQAYYFLSHELRPGSGIVRSLYGRRDGPGGALTCFLLSAEGRLHFAASGHVLSRFWEAAREGSIYNNVKGFPATDSRYFLGKMRHLSPRPEPVSMGTPLEGEPFVDVGIVEVEEVEERRRWRQSTTCYNKFKIESDDGTVGREASVIKCGPEEPHSTEAKVVAELSNVTVYGPEGKKYELKGQIIVEDPEPRKTAFAVPGDSGTLVVDRSKTKRPVGMLIAGSVVDGRYVVTPFSALRKFWEDLGFEVPEDPGPGGRSPRSRRRAGRNRLG